MGLTRAQAEPLGGAPQVAAAVAATGLKSVVGQAVQLPSVDVVREAGRLAVLPVELGISAALAQGAANVEAAEAKAKATTGILAPQVAVRLSAQYANPNTRYFPIKEEWNSSWNASAIVSWQLSGPRWFDAQSARLQAEAASAGLAAMRRQTEVELAQALVPIELAPKQLEVSAERIRIAARAVAATETAVSEGRATRADLLDREADLAMARAAELKTALEVVVAAHTARTLRGAYGPN